MYIVRGCKMNLKELMLNNEKCYNILNSKIVLDFSPDGYLSISDYSINDNMLVLKKGFDKHLLLKDLLPFIEEDYIVVDEENIELLHCEYIEDSTLFSDGEDLFVFYHDSDRFLRDNNNSFVKNGF